MKHSFVILLFIFGSWGSFSQNTWTNVVDNGVDPTGKVKCTQIISKLIEQLAKKGGGTLFFPAGTFLTGPIIMKSNITLYTDPGAVIKFSDDFDDYLPMVKTRYEDIRVNNFVSQIYAYQCENIAIRGDGHFEGQGKKWWDFMYSLQKPGKVESKWQEIFRKANTELFKKYPDLSIGGKANFLRPPMITTYECKNVLIEGVSFSNPPLWTIMPAFTDNISITGVTIENPGNSPNTDGIDPSSCRNVHISNCHISVGDDCIVIKSGRDEDGREANRPTENITIDNCTMLRGHGGVVVGSEMSGGVKRVAISNCVFDGTNIGIRIKTMRGRGGVVEDIRVSNALMYNILNEGILITYRYHQTQPEPVSERTPALNNIHLSGISIRNADRPIVIYGLEEQAASHISFNDLQLYSKHGILVENASDVSFHDIRMEIKEGNPFEAKDSKKISYDLISVKTPVQDSPYLKLSNCQDVRVTNCYQSENIPLFMNEDEKSEDIYIMNNILPGTQILSNNKGKNIVSQNNLVKK